MITIDYDEKGGFTILTTVPDDHWLIKLAERNVGTRTFTKIDQKGELRFELKESAE